MDPVSFKSALNQPQASRLILLAETRAEPTVDRVYSASKMPETSRSALPCLNIGGMDELTANNSQAVFKLLCNLSYLWWEPFIWRVCCHPACQRPDPVSAVGLCCRDSCSDGDVKNSDINTSVWRLTVLFTWPQQDMVEAHQMFEKEANQLFSAQSSLKCLHWIALIS